MKILNYIIKEETIIGISPLFCNANRCDHTPTYLSFEIYTTTGKIYINSDQEDFCSPFKEDGKLKVFSEAYNFARTVVEGVVCKTNNPYATHINEVNELHTNLKNDIQKLFTELYTYHPFHFSGINVRVNTICQQLLHLRNLACK